MLHVLVSCTAKNYADWYEAGKITQGYHRIKIGVINLVTSV